MRYILLICAVALLAALWIGLDPFAGDGDGTPTAIPVGTYLSDGAWVGAPLQSPAKPLNLVVIVLDTLRADVASPTGVMPQLEALAQRGMRVTNAASPAVWTYPALASLLTGLHPSEHRVHQSPTGIFLSRTVTSYAEALATAHGYQTAALIEVDFEPSHSSMLQGFEHVRRRLPLRGAREELRRWSAKRDPTRPFFLFLHTYEAHTPYGIENHPWPERPHDPSLRPLGDVDPLTMPIQDLLAALDLDWRTRQHLLRSELRERVLDRSIHYRVRGWAAAPDLAFAARLEAAYRKGAADLDGELAKTVDALERQGLLENTLLVVTSDHGEGFGEHGVLTHGFCVHDELVRIPLVMVGPEPFTGGRRVDTSMALHDVMPTFMDLARLPPLRDRHGRSMLAALKSNDPGRGVLTMEWMYPSNVAGDAGILQLSARTIAEKYIITLDLNAGTIREELYDLKLDPGAHHDLLGETSALGQTPVSAALARSIEEARDQVWLSISGAGALAHMGYSSTHATIESPRPPPPTVRVPSGRP